MTITRRTLLKGGAVVVLYSAMAGCSSDGASPSAGPVTTAAGGADGGTGRDVPDPEAWTITRWRADPFARGSYSFLAVGSSPDDRRALAAPVGDRLFFAGEATSVDDPGTVHGALTSGREAAEAVADVAEPGATVLVLGAGMAGLGAARQLQDAGFDVRVLEGRDRPGGRTFTDDSLGLPLDLGASWIHGTDGNPLTALADELEVERSAPTDWDNAVEHGPDGDELDAGTAAEAETAVEEVLAYAAEQSEDREEDAPLRDVVEEALADLELGPDVENVARHYLNTSIEHEYAGALEELSTWWWDEGEGYPGEDVLLLPGYVALVDGLADGLDVETGAVVATIASGDDGVVVRTDAGDEHAADHVVVTLPLGVLQAGDVTFDPPLPEDKRAAIDRLGMGLLDKVYLRFPEVFWDADADAIGWTSPDAEGRWAEWLNLAKVTGEPVLLGFNAAGYAEQVEAMGDDEV
ncbi:MAG TPA: FAD-dependent oxidoreductase, partial [Acidimicrobiales bacterium]|nr:FAD-dependent oxidoreductase [Acidimicrobiales bacterium]